MNTKKRFYEDAYIRSCRAVVQECRAAKGRFEIVLDQTCFYPEGGGQPGDTGFLNETPVFDTHERDGYILHYTKMPVEPGTEVLAAIDWDRRFDLMQQHSGEHMISGYIHSRWGYDNVGFHMGADRTTIDLSGELTPEDLSEIENAVNERIWLDTPVNVRYPSADELSHMAYRSKKELTGDVRIVEFPGTDVCACCGMHVDRTGAVGLVKILSCERFHEGVRLEILCGRRAMRYLCGVYEQNRRISQQLSARPLETAQAVSSLAAELNEKRQRVYALEEAAFAAKAAELEGAGDVLVFLEDLDPDGVRRACDAIQKKCGGRAAVFSGTDTDGYRYAVGLPGGDLKELTKNMNAALNGRGGGKPFFVQGSVRASKESIQAFFRSVSTPCSP